MEEQRKVGSEMSMWNSKCVAIEKEDRRKTI